MTGLSNAVRQAFNNCIVDKCARHGCSVDLKGVPEPNVVVDFDGQGASFKGEGSRCDYLFVADGNPGWVVPIEITRGRKDAGTITRQLQAGSKAAECVLPNNVTAIFRPVFAGKTKKYDRDKVRRAKIIFRGRKYDIDQMQCGALLNRVLKSR